MDNTIIRAKIYGKMYLPLPSEPYKKPLLRIDSIEHYYKDGGYNVSLNAMMGFSVDEGFYTILPSECEVELFIKEVEDRDKYYEGSEFKRSCFNKSVDNPYQLPRWEGIE